jgi:multiple sugar transport system substrate-binding protein
MRLNVLVVGYLLLLTACHQPKKEITIQGENSSNLQAMEALKSDYEQKENIRLIFKPSSMEDAFTKATQDLANKTGLYDIVLQYNVSLSSFVKNNYVFRLDELKRSLPDSSFAFEKDLLANVWKEVGYYYTNPRQPKENEISPVSYPFSANTMILVYNKDLFNDPAQQKAYAEKYKVPLSVPRDLSSFKQVAEFFTQPDKNIKGVCLEGAAGGWLYYEFCNFLQAFGGKVLDKDQGWKGSDKTPVLLDNESGQQAARFYLSLKPFSAGNFATTDGVEQRNIMKTGKVAMSMMWSDYIWGLINEANGKFDTRFGFAPGPGNRSMIAGGAFYVSRQSKNITEAFKYICNLMQNDIQVKLVKKGLCSPLLSAYNDSSVQNIPYIPALKEALTRADYMMEAGPDADLISNIITKYVQKMFINELTSEEALKAAKAEIENDRKAFYK